MQQNITHLWFLLHILVGRIGVFIYMFPEIINDFSE